MTLAGKKLSGLIAATYTPMDDDGQIVFDQIAPMTEHLAAREVDGFYVCGSTGEGVSMTSEERCKTAELYTSAAKSLAQPLPVVVQVGHNSLEEARRLAAHAATIEADAISANAPSYFKVNDVETLVDCMAAIAEAAPSLPFYYYHIPVLTGSNVDVLDFLKQAADRIPNLAGVKYTAPTVHGFQDCLRWQDGRYVALWGSDEMLLSALVVGAQGAVGSTYNIAAPLYQRIIRAFQANDLETARDLMSKSVTMIRTIYQYPFHSAMKAVMGMQGISCGRCRLPQRDISTAQAEKLRGELDAIGFFEWTEPA